MNITELMKELAAGQEARERIPTLEKSMADIIAASDKLATHNQALETNIIGYKQSISDLTAKVRSLEVERDDAGFRELEAADKLNTLLQAVRGAWVDVNNAAVAVDPPKPEPTPLPLVPDAPVSLKPSDTGFYERDMLATKVYIVDHRSESAADPTNNAVSVSQSQGSVTSSVQQDATSTSSDQSDSSYHPFATSEAPKSPEPVAPKTDKPYLGMAWYDRPHTVSHEDWRNGGGQL